MKKLIHIDNMTKEELKRELSFYMKERKSAPEMKNVYKVPQNEFHGGSVISNHRSLRSALKSALKNDCVLCTCGGPLITGVDFDILTAYDYHYYTKNITKPEAIELAVGEVLKDNYKDIWPIKDGAE